MSSNLTARAITIMKKCNKCKQNKDLSKFHKNLAKKDGLSYQCKSCLKEYHRKHYSLNKDKIKKIERERKRKVRASNKMHLYGGQQRDYENLLRLQSRCCAICKTNSENLVVDHCHICGFGKLEAVRGLLCNGCNKHIHFSIDNPKFLLNVVRYSLVHYREYHG